jgi:hypothetical protein
MRGHSKHNPTLAKMKGKHSGRNNYRKHAAKVGKKRG